MDNKNLRRWIESNKVGCELPHIFHCVVKHKIKEKEFIMDNKFRAKLQLNQCYGTSFRYMEIDFSSVDETVEQFKKILKEMYGEAKAYNILNRINGKGCNND